MLEKAKDAIYESVVEKDAEELSKLIGNQKAIENYVEKNKIPDRSSSYQLLYDALIEKLDDEKAKKLFESQFYFVKRKKISVLWESFEEQKQKEEKAAQERQYRERLVQIDDKLAKINRVELTLKERKATFTEEKNNILTKLGEPIKPTSLEKTKEVVKEEIPIKKETIKEEVPVQQVEPSQDEIAEALLKESQLFGDQPSFDPNMREEAPDIQDEIMRGF